MMNGKPGEQVSKTGMRFGLRSLFAVITLVALEAAVVAAVRRDAGYREWVIGFSFLLLSVTILYVWARLISRRQDVAALVLLTGVFPFLLAVFACLLFFLTASEFEFRSLGRQSGRVFQEVEDFSATLAAESP
ncbi:MAG TPA: hypothetical protein VHD36_21400 [Pirellulales bacterium]|nr:hypothetical protein [Pirellulales bacterium]